MKPSTLIMQCLYMLLSLSLVGCKPEQQSVAPLPKPALDSTADMTDGIVFNRVSDVEQRFNQIKGTRIEDLATAIAEVDEWLYAPEDEKAARVLIDKQIGVLRDKINSDISALQDQALKAENGKLAQQLMSRINALLALYPAPVSDTQHIALDKLTTEILKTSKRIEEIQRLRYNEWAIMQIQKSLDSYHGSIKVESVADLKKLVQSNKDELINTCATSLSKIDPSYLEPAVLDLYNYAYGLIRDAMGSNELYLVKLSKVFANHSNERRSPTEF